MHPTRKSDNGVELDTTSPIQGSGLDQRAPGRPTSPVGGSGRAPTLEPGVWPDERPRGSFGAGRPPPPQAGPPGLSALRSEGLRTAAPGSVSPSLTDMSTLRKQRHFNLVATMRPRSNHLGPVRV